MVRIYKLTGLRKAIGERLGYSMRNSLPVALMTDFDASALLGVYRGFRQELGDNGPSITAIIVKAVGDMLTVYRQFNANVEGDEVRELDEVNIAVAVDTPRGLYAPTIRNVDKKSYVEVEQDLRLLVDKAVKGVITLNELSGHGFTVSNLGQHDILFFNPIINPPDICILGVGAIRDVGGSFRGHLTLVFDHRVVDGAPAASFLREIKRKLETLSR